MGRRGHGEGTIYQRADGLWIGRIIKDGKAKSVSGKTKGEARQRLDALVDGGQVSKATTPLRTYLAEWLEYKRMSVKPNSYRYYERAVTQDINPRIGDMPLGELTTQHVDRFLLSMLDAGRSPKLQVRARITLSGACERAVDLELLEKNPVAKAAKPNYKRKEPRTWTREEQARFLAYVINDEWAALWMLALTTGMRIGEMLGLNWEQVDLKRGIMTVDRQLLEIDMAQTPDAELKRETSRRVLRLNSLAVSALTRHRADLLKRGQAALPQVFPSRPGGYLLQGNVRRAFYRLQGAAGVPKLTPHQARHTLATTWLKDGEDPTVVQKQLGHATVAITLSTYNHVTAATQDDVAARQSEKLIDALQSVTDTKVDTGA